MKLNKRADMLTFLLHVISMVFVLVIVVFVIALLLPSQPGIYTIFSDMVESAETGCNPNHPAHVATPLTVEPGYFMVQVYYNPTEIPGCLEEYETIPEEKFWEACPYECDPGTFCLCVGKTTTQNHGIVFKTGLSGEPPDVDFNPSEYYSSVTADRTSKCWDLSNGGLEIEDNSLCCATVRCSTSQGLPVYLNNITGLVFDGIYADPPGAFPDYGAAITIEGQFRFTRLSPDERSMHITYR